MVDSMEQWVGKVAVVTGASAGIGAAIAEHLVTYGLKVIGLARRKERVEELSRKLSTKKGKLYSLKCDVAKEDDILKAFKWIDENVGPIQVLVNNAGVVENTTLIEGDTKAWKKVFDVNVMGLTIATREAIKIMRKSNLPSHIININSTAGHKAIYHPFINVYTASKHAVTAVTSSFATELQFSRINNIKITSISPGATRTEIGNNIKMTPEMAAAMAALPFMRPDDIADSVDYVLSTPPGVQVDELTIQPLHEPN